MTEQTNKTALKLQPTKSNISDTKSKPRALNPNKRSGQINRNSKIGFLPTETLTKNYFEKNFGGSSLKLELLELSPGTLTERTSEGVQDFIKQVSNYIENKNSFEETSTCMGDKYEEMLDSSSVVFNMKEKNFQNREKYNSGLTNRKRKNEVLKTNMKNYKKEPKLETLRIAQFPKKSVELKSQVKKKKLGNSSKIRDENEKKSSKVSSSSMSQKKPEESEPITLNSHYSNELNKVQTARREEGRSSRPSSRQNVIKRKRPSEIPLRINRTNLSRWPKQVSMLLHKPVNEIDSALSHDFYPKEKSFSPIEELSICSELQITINPVENIEKLLDSDNTVVPTSTKSSQVFEKENNNEVTEEKCITNLCTPVISNIFLNKSAEENSAAEKKMKMLDLEKVKTSSFTVLTTNSTVLDRLESLHKKNVSTKETFNAVSYTKSKVIVSKLSFSSLKIKGSKKNLSTRLCSKGNKPGLKAKEKKCKKEIEEIQSFSKKRPLTRLKSMACNGKGTTTAEAVRVLQKKKTEKVTVEDQTFSQKTKNKSFRLSKLGGKSSLKNLKPEPKERIKTPLNSRSTSSKLFDEFHKSGKSSLPKSSTYRNENVEENSVDSSIGSKTEKSIPITPPPTPVTSQSISVASDYECRQLEGDETLLKTLILDKKGSQEISTCSDNKAEIGNSGTKVISTTEGRNSLKVRERISELPINFWKDEPPEKPKSSDSKPKSGKIQLKIDLTSQDNNMKYITTPNKKILQSVDWLYVNSNKCNGESFIHKTVSDDLKSKVKDGNCNRSSDSNSRDNNEESVQREIFHLGLPRPLKNCSSHKKKPQYKTSGVSMKAGRKKKIRSDVGTQLLSSSNAFFKSNLCIQNQPKPDANLRSDLLKCGTSEEQNDVFENSIAVKLRRHNSEPHSFRGYILKRTGFATSRGHKPSVSSVASSLKHLNTDDIDDFMFWEPVPQKLTSCWEMSLYHFKKTWTVLSCSVFKDNRESNTPGLILENLKNGRRLNTKQSNINENERVNCHKENPFDVEPSISQKNIDIRNWLAALNFPAPPSTSTNAIREGNFSVQPVVNTQDLNKVQTNPKRRKVLPDLKLNNDSLEIAERTKKMDKYKTSTSWNTNEAEDLMELIRRKSGSFVTEEQTESCLQDGILNSVDCSISTEEQSVSREEKERNLPSEQRDYSETATEMSSPNQIEQSHSCAKIKKFQAEGSKFNIRKSFLQDLCLFPSEVNIWKYLFIFTLLFIVIHYLFF